MNLRGANITNLSWKEASDGCTEQSQPVLAGDTGGLFPNRGEGLSSSVGSLAEFLCLHCFQTKRRNREPGEHSGTAER